MIDAIRCQCRSELVVIEQPLDDDFFDFTVYEFGGPTYKWRERIKQAWEALRGRGLPREFEFNREDMKRLYISIGEALIFKPMPRDALEPISDDEWDTYSKAIGTPGWEQPTHEG